MVGNEMTFYLQDPRPSSLEHLFQNQKQLRFQEPILRNAGVSQGICILKSLLVLKVWSLDQPGCHYLMQKSWTILQTHII
jgi:hypothetical protein